MFVLFDSYVMPNRMLEQIAEKLPTSSEDILACGKHPVPVVRKNMRHLLQLISKARQLPDETLRVNVGSISNKTNNYTNFSEICSRSDSLTKTDPSVDKEQKSGYAWPTIINEDYDE